MFERLSCCSCTWVKTFYTSPEVKRKETTKQKGRKMFDINNARAVIAFREIGCGYTPMKTKLVVVIRQWKLSRLL